LMMLHVLNIGDDFVYFSYVTIWKLRFLYDNNFSLNFHKSSNAYSSQSDIQMSLEMCTCRNLRRYVMLYGLIIT
jgi:hypothetical protein